MPDNFAPPVPAVVKAEAARADALQAEYAKSLNGETPPPDGNEEDGELEEAPRETRAKAPAEPVQTETPPPAVQEPEIDEGGWRHRYESMQGRYNAEVPKLRGQVQQLMGQVNNLNKLLATVQRPDPPPQAAETTFKSSVKPEEIAEYGPEFVDLVGRIVKDSTAAHVAEISQLKNQLKHVGGQIGAGAREQMMNRLANDIPNWEEINTNQDFLDWLALPDAYSGDIRHNMLHAAFERNDAPRVTAFFKGFLAEMAAVQPPEPEPGKKAVTLNKTPLRNLAAPGRARSTAAPSPAPVEKPIITASEIATFYTELGLGKWRGREKEAKEMEAQIFAAQAEGRIR